MKLVNCAIIQDLLPSYCDKISSKETNSLVEKHLESCDKCRKKLENLNKNLYIETINNQQEDKKIDFLKKYNRKMFILKILASILAIIILFMWAVLAINYVKKKNNYKKATYIYNIIDETYKNIAIIENSNNYKFVHEWIDGKYILLYKDGNYKEESNADNGFNYTNYGIRLENKSINVQYIDNKMAGDAIIYHVIDRNVLAYYHKREISDYINSDIRNEFYEGKEYYVIKFVGNTINNEIYKEEIWIDKENMLLFKISHITEENEDKYTWTINDVTDEDVKVKDEEGYMKLQEMFKKFHEDI